MKTTKHPTRRLKRRAWLQRQTILSLEEGAEITAKEILQRIRENNSSPTLRGWCEASSVAMGMILREIVSAGFIRRDKLPTGTFCYSLDGELDVEKYNRFFGDRGLHPSQRV